MGYFVHLEGRDGCARLDLGPSAELLVLGIQEVVPFGQDLELLEQLEYGLAGVLPYNNLQRSVDFVLLFSVPQLAFQIDVLLSKCLLTVGGLCYTCPQVHQFLAHRFELVLEADVLPGQRQYLLAGTF